MRKTVKQFLYIIGIVLVGNAVYAQNKNLEKVITVSANNKPVKQVLREIEKEVGITFSYKHNLFDPDKTVTIDYSNKTLGEILKVIFEGNNIKFFEVDNQVVMYKPATNKIIEKKKTDTLFLKNTITKHDTIHTIQNDTVYILKTDTLIITKVDTIVQKFYDTIVKTVYEEKLKANTKKSQSTIELFLKTAFYNNNLGLPQNFDPQYDIKVQTSTKMSRYWSFGVMATKSFNNSVASLGVGLKYRLDNNEFVYKQAIKDPIDTTQIVDSTNVFEKQINKYQYLTIPIHHSWQTELSEKTELGVGIGLWINFLLSAEGIGNKNREEYSIIDVNDLALKKMGVDLMINGLFTYSISSRWKVLFKPLFEIQVTSDYRNNYTLFKNRVSFGSILGIQLTM